MIVNLTYAGFEMGFEEEEILIPGLHYERMCQIPSDINELLPIIKSYAEECESVTEMGVRFACSTWAFIEAKPKKLTCIDIYYGFFKPSEKYVKKLCKEYKIDFKWVTGDSLKIDIEDTDLLFIDTLHSYNQLYSELNRHHNNVKKYILLHDTETFAERDEEIYDHASELVKNQSNSKIGLVSAIDDFLANNKCWIRKQVYVHNNGLTILERVS